MRFFSRKSPGFSLVEILIVIVVIGILAALTINYYSGARERAYLTRADADIQAISNAVKLYAQKNDVYPAEVSRDVPADVKDSISLSSGSTWPNAPWPGSIFDYDAWDLDADGTTETIQVSVRFCPAGGPLSACKFPKESWAASFGINSAYYYCIKGYCRPYSTEAVTYPGYCVNCPNHAAVKKPSE